MIEAQYLEDCVLQLRKLKSLAEKAIAQIDEDRLFAVLDPEGNSIAVLMKHMAGNMRSRWTDFLTSDGEKPDRHRDTEFIQEPNETRAIVMARWEDGWRRTLDAISALEPADLARTVTVRGERHSVLEAINRQMTHYAMHVGQIVLLARHYAGPSWTSLSIPRGQSRTFDVSKSGDPYGIPAGDQSRRP
jgi:hypothetical protein